MVSYQRSIYPSAGWSWLELAGAGGVSVGGWRNREEKLGAGHDAAAAETRARCSAAEKTIFRPNISVSLRSVSKIFYH